MAWKIIDLTFDVPRPPRVLRECAALAVEQVDFSAIAYTWLASNRDKAAARSSEPCLSYLDMSGVHRDVHLQQEMAPESPRAAWCPGKRARCAEEFRSELWEIA